MIEPAEEKGGCTCSHPPPSIVTTATNVLPPPCPVHNIILLPDIREQDAALRAEVAERGKDLEDAADSLFKAVARADAAEARLETARKALEEIAESMDPFNATPESIIAAAHFRKVARKALAEVKP